MESIYKDRTDKLKKINTKIPSEEELLRLKEVLSQEHVHDKQIILEKSNVSFKQRVLDRILKENEEFRLLYANIYSNFIPQKIQRLSNEEFLKLIEDLKQRSYEKVSKDWDIGIKSLIVISKKYIGKRAVKGGSIDISKSKSYIKEQRSILRKEIGSKTETWIEKIVRAILISSKIDFSSEIYLLHQKHRCDFILNNTKKVIEVNGDFWHGYNKSIEDMDDFLKKSINRYNDKLEFYKNNNYEVLEIWEWEINSNLNNVINKIKKYAEI
jgi:very-short-patch-repair endonuclease